MRKFISILFALVLVLSMSLIPAMPVAAEDGIVPNPTFCTVNMANPLNPTTPSTEISIGWERNPDIAGEGFSDTDAIHVTTSVPTVDYAMVIVPTDFILGDSTGISYWGYTVTDSQVKAPDEIFLFLDASGDTTYNTLLTSHKPGAEAAAFYGTWDEWNSMDTFRTTLNPTGINEWHEPTSGNYEELVDPNAYSTARVLAIALTAGPSMTSGAVDVDVYFDRLTVNGDVLLDNDTGTIVVPEPFPGQLAPCIQDAIDAALPGDTISVAAGVYTEWQDNGYGESAGIIIDKPLHLQGSGDDCIIRGKTGTTFYMPYSPIVWIKADNVEIDRFKFDGATYTEAEPKGLRSYGINSAWKVDSVDHAATNLNVHHNTFAFIGTAVTHDRAGGGNITVANNTMVRETRQVWYDPPGATPGSYVDKTLGGGGVTLWSVDGSVHDNTGIETPGIGIALYGCENLTIGPGNIVSAPNTTDPSDAGIYINGGSNITVTGNTVSNFKNGEDPMYTCGKKGAGIFIYSGGCDGFTIENNDLTSNSVGVYVATVESMDTPTNVEVHNNNIEGNDNYGVCNFRFPSEMKDPDTGEKLKYWEYDKFSAANNDVDATSNWWGTVNGPTHAGNTFNVDEQGDTVSDYVDYVPWLDATYDTGVSFAPVENADTGEQFSSIQAAIDDSETLDNHTINVAAGTYNEAILIDRPLTLRGATAGVNKNGYTVPAGYAWDDTVESIINHPNPSGGYTTIVDIVDVDNVTFEGFVVQELNAVGNLNSSLLRVYAHTQEISNIVVRNNVIGPNTNTTAQDGAQGRMGLYIVNHPYSDNGVVNSTFSGNKIFDCKGDGNNVFVWSSYYAYGAPGPASMSGTVIEDNEIYGSHRSGIETAGGFSGLTIRNNKIYGNSGLPSDDPNHLKYGNGILLIRGSSDKTSGPTTAYGPEDLTIIDNEIYDNEKNAIYMGPINKDYTINGNKIYDNGWDGIRLDLEGTYWNPTFEPEPSEWSCYDGSENIAAHFNNIYDNVGYGVQVVGTPTNGFVLNATNNWWGTKAGGLIKTKKVSGSVDYDPWIGAKAKNSKSKKTGTDDETVDARDEAGTEVVKKGKGKPTITVTEYIDNPGDGAPGGFTSAGKYIDVHIDDPEDVDEIEIRNYYTEADITGLDEATLRLSWWNGTLWVECSDSGVNTADTDGYSGYVWAKIRDDTTPTLDDMAGTPFMSIGIPPAAPPPVGGGGGGGGGGAVVFSPAISNLTITPAEGAIAEVRIGEIVTITTEVENTGGRSGSYTVTLKINGVVEKEKTVTLAAYAKETVTFTVIREEAGTYKIEVNGLEGEFIVPELPAATFEATDLSISPAKVKVGETVTISVLVAETSGVSGSYDATLKINGTVVEKQEVTLGPQQSQTVTFTIANQEAGSYKVEVNGLVSEFTVEAPAPEAPSPPAPAPPPAKAINWWLIGGIIAAVVVVGSVTFILVRRRAY